MALMMSSGIRSVQSCPIWSPAILLLCGEAIVIPLIFCCRNPHGRVRGRQERVPSGQRLPAGPGASAPPHTRFAFRALVDALQTLVCIIDAPRATCDERVVGAGCGNGRLANIGASTVRKAARARNKRMQS